MTQHIHVFAQKKKLMQSVKKPRPNKADIADTTELAEKFLKKKHAKK